jgi:Flp pilus assembly protein TadG
MGVAARFKRTEGATLVEFAISASVLFSMLFGIMELGLLFYAYNFTSEAAREATRWASVRGSTSCTNTPSLSECNATTAQITSFVRGLGYPGVTSGNISVTTTYLTATTSAGTTTWSSCAGTCNLPQNAVNVKVTYPFPLGVPFVPVTTITVGASSRMIVYQ